MSKTTDDLQMLIDRFKSANPFVPELSDIPLIIQAAIDQIERYRKRLYGYEKIFRNISNERINERSDDMKYSTGDLYRLINELERLDVDVPFASVTVQAAIIEIKRLQAAPGESAKLWRDVFVTGIHQGITRKDCISRAGEAVVEYEKWLDAKTTHKTYEVGTFPKDSPDNLWNPAALQDDPRTYEKWLVAMTEFSSQLPSRLRDDVNSELAYLRNKQGEDTK